MDRLQSIRLLIHKISGELHGLSLTPPMPIIANIDPVDFCVLKCPICPTGSGKNKYKQSIMPLALFKKILDDIPTLKTVALFNWGEPFLNPHVGEIIRSAKDKGIYVFVHSNMNVRKDGRFWSEIIASGLDSIQISLDGASQSAYEIYRQGGDMELALSNIRTIITKKREIGFATPKLTWKFIVTRHNEHEISKAKQEAEKLGIAFRTDFFGLGDLMPDMPTEDLEKRKDYWLPTEKRYIAKRFLSNKKPPFRTYCPYLWQAPAITPSGKVFPCCYVTDERLAFGDVSKESFQTIWHNEMYKHSRSLFSRRRYETECISTVCSSCNNYMKRKAGSKS